MLQLTVAPEQAGRRLDQFLAEYLPDRTRSAIQKMIEDGLVTADGKKAAKNLKLKAGVTVEVTEPEPEELELEPEDLPLPVVYEDDDLLVVNKPKGMVVHPAAGHYTGTLVNAVMYHCGDSLSGINGVLRPGIVHRIDMDTTGSIIICKNDTAHRSIADQLAEHSIRRAYRAIVLGNIREDSLTIDKPIGRDPSDRKRMAVRPDGKRAVTHVQVLERFGDYTYVECRLETGRTHQIRVHLSHCHHPLLGDTVYGSRKKTPFATQGQCLHARTLGFIHPSTGQYIETEAPMPAYFEKILQTLRNRSGA